MIYRTQQAQTIQNGANGEKESDYLVNNAPEISNYHVVDIGEFHDGLARVTVYIYDKGYWSSVASSAGYNDGYFLYGYMDIEGNLPIKPIYNSAPDKIDGIALVEVYEGVNQNRVDIIDVNGNSMLPIIGDLNEAVSYGEVSKGAMWIKTVDKKLQGNIYTITYYNADGKMFAFENADVVRYYSNSDKNSYSNFFTRFPKALIKIDGIERLINNSGEIYTFEAVGFEELLIPYWGDPYNFVDIGITKYSSNDYVEVVIYKQRPGEKIYSEHSYGKIDWESNTITCVDYDEYKDALVTYEEIAESYYDYTFESMTGVDIDVIDFAESAVNNEDFTTLCLRNKDYEYFYCIIKRSVFDENSEFVDKKIILDATQDIILSNYNPRPYYNKSDDEYMYSFNDGLCLAKDVASGLYGYLNTDGQWEIQPQYQKAGEFSEGYATVNGNTIIDTNGNIVLNTNN